MRPTTVTTPLPVLQPTSCKHAAERCSARCRARITAANLVRYSSCIYFAAPRETGEVHGVFVSDYTAAGNLSTAVTVPEVLKSNSYDAPVTGEAVRLRYDDAVFCANCDQFAEIDEDIDRGNARRGVDEAHAGASRRRRLVIVEQHDLFSAPAVLTSAIDVSVAADNVGLSVSSVAPGVACLHGDRALPPRFADSSTHPGTNVESWSAPSMKMFSGDPTSEALMTCTARPDVDDDGAAHIAVQQCHVDQRAAAFAVHPYRTPRVLRDRR